MVGPSNAKDRGQKQRHHQGFRRMKALSGFWAMGVPAHHCGGLEAGP